MRNLLAVVALLFAVAVPALAQDAVPSHAQTADPVATAVAQTEAQLSGKWTGRFDWKSMPAYGAWQSLRSDDQAVGLSKHLWTLAKNDIPVLSVGVFAGINKPIFSPGVPVKFLAGPVVAVPGSALDWALGTSWGQQWLPKLKTGVTFAYDVSRINELHANPSFIGAGASYPIGG